MLGDRIVLGFANAQSVYPSDALARLDEIDGLTAKGRDGLARLAAHLSFVQPRTAPGALLSEYLFTRSRYLDAVLADDSVAGQQQRLALFQLLQFAIEHRPVGRGNPRRQLLQWIRRLETFGEERQLRQMPSAAAGIDAVRLLTVHASKGLEFRVVYLPGLGNQMFPIKRQYNPCPPPVGMLGENPEDSHAEEEECLFFVAMSRARDILHLSRADNYSASRRTAPSSLLTDLAAHLPRAPDGPARWRDGGPPEPDEEPLTHLAPGHDLHAAEDLDQYLKCPRAYLYQRILDLSGARDDNAYVQFHRAVYSVLRWMRGPEAPTALGREEAMARLNASWQEVGPDAPVYRETAEGIIERALTRRASGAKPLDADWVITRPGGQIKLSNTNGPRGSPTAPQPDPAARPRDCPIGIKRFRAAGATGECALNDAVRRVPVDRRVAGPILPRCFSLAIASSRLTSVPASRPPIQRNTA